VLTRENEKARQTDPLRVRSPGTCGGLFAQPPISDLLELLPPNYLAVMRPRQPPIQITRRTQWPWLLKQITARGGRPVAVLGRGHHARRLLHRLFREAPPEVEMQIFTNDEDFVAILNPDGELRWDPPRPAARYPAPLKLVALRRDPARFNRAK
jgi:hypothetical protein